MDFESVEADLVREFLSEDETQELVHALTGVNIAVAPSDLQDDDSMDVADDEPSLFTKEKLPTSQSQSQGSKDNSSSSSNSDGKISLAQLHADFVQYSKTSCPNAMPLPPPGSATFNAPSIQPLQQCMTTLSQVHSRWSNSSAVLPFHLAGSLMFPERSLSLVGHSFLGLSAYCHPTLYMKLLLFQHQWGLDPANEAKTTPSVFHIMNHWDCVANNKPAKKTEFDGLILGKTILRFYVTVFAGLDAEARLFYTLQPLPPRTSIDLRPIPPAVLRQWYFVDIPDTQPTMRLVQAARKHAVHARGNPGDLVRIQNRPVVLNCNDPQDADFVDYESNDGAVIIDANGTRTYPVPQTFDAKWLSYTYQDPSCWNSQLSTICDQHHGQEFLSVAGDFKRKYAQTVIARIYYSWCKRASRLTLTNLRSSDIVESLHTLWTSDDQNRAKDYFSYEHFYVLYCHFWELDGDHDLLLGMNDLLLYDDGALCHEILPRIADPHKLRADSDPETMQTYEDFISFLLSEVDKTTAPSHRYWMQRLDLDCDGLLGGADITVLLQGQARKVHSAGGELVAVEDLACQVWDQLHCATPEHHCSTCHAVSSDPLGGPRSGVITTTMLAQSKLSSTVLDLLFNLSKFVQGETKDASRLRLQQGPKVSDWQRWAAQAYFQLAGSDSDNRS